MYERFFGFEERPFELTANPRYLFLTERYREALGTLTYGLSSRKGMLVMTGEAGTGKTTMLTVAMAGLHANQLVVYLSNPTLTRAEFIEFMTAKLGLPESVGSSKTRFLEAVTQLLESRADADLLTALVIDEAHSLPNELLEEVRLLANIERPDRKLLTVVLVGQPELAGRLNEPALRQLKQRVALRCELVPLTLRESAAYIAKRISLAGGDSAQVFTREAVLAVYEYSAGIPRMINVLCDNALVNAYARDEHLVAVNIVEEVARDFDLQARVRVEADVSRQPHDAPPPAARRQEPPAPPLRVQASRGAATPPIDDHRAEALTAMTTAAAARPAIQASNPGLILDLRPANSLAGSRYEPDPEPRRSFWSALQFWKR